MKFPSAVFWSIRCLSVALVLCVAPLTTQAQSLSEIDGTWSVTRGTLSGENVPNNSLSTMSLTFSSGNFTAKSGGLESGGAVAVAIVGTTQLNFMINSGADAGKTVKALYRLENGTLTVTFSQDDQFPSTHDSTAANKYCTLVYRKGSGIAAAPTSPAPIDVSGSSNSNAAASIE